ncbi:hypothetical protein [Nocardia pseudovaccinii]|uniref:hypothetical protein n=1 Tax=Nocardia pseudovaccinii TaxID=189540 RepID=UPI0007A53BB4|nr:hypothetical protein [Nocardia pseudovaccinii]
MIGNSKAIRRMLTVILAVGALTLTAACTTDSPKEQPERERKAATVPVFKLHMTNDLWTRTNHNDDNFGPQRNIDKPKNLAEEPNGMVTVELTGPQMVDYLQILDYNGHGGAAAKEKALAMAVYDVVAPVVDKIETPPAPGAPAPEITITAAVGSGTPTPSATTAPAAPSSGR